MKRPSLVPFEVLLALGGMLTGVVAAASSGPLLPLLGAAAAGALVASAGWAFALYRDRMGVYRIHKVIKGER